MTRTNTKAKSGGAVVRLLALCLVAFAAIGASGDNSATTANAAGDSRFRGNDGTGGNDGLSFTAFYRQQQAHLLSSLDAALSQKAEDTLLGFSAMRKAEVNLQTKLGGRKSQLGVNLIGAFADAGHYAAGWQLRAYGGGEDSKGVNAGVFYRQINNGNILYGVNAFADYEDGNYGNFLRYSFGGEIQNTLFAINANYYIPETEGRPLGGGVLAYSRRGFDINFRLNVPKWHFMKMRADYYKFDGKNGRKADVGFRYGVELEMPSFNGLQVGVLYDGGSDKFGGDLTYTHTIGEPPVRHYDDAAAAPDLFAAASREYSQRIVKLTMTQLVPTLTTFVTTRTPITTAMMTRTEPRTMPGMTITMTVTNTTPPPFPRAASVNATTFHFSDAVQVRREYVVETVNKFLITLPPDSQSRPHVLTFPVGSHTFSLLTVSVISAVNGGCCPAGRVLRGLLQNTRPYAMTIVQGSEDLVPTVTTAMTTTRTEGDRQITITITTAATTTTVTTIVEMVLFRTVTLAANDAIHIDGKMPPPPNMPQMASADMPVIHHQKRAHYRHSRLPRHSRERMTKRAGGLIPIPRA